MKANQLVGQNEVSNKAGIVIVLASLAALYLISSLASILSSIGLTPLFTSIIFWGLGGTVCVIVYYLFIIRYLYSVDGVIKGFEGNFYGQPVVSTVTRLEKQADKQLIRVPENSTSAENHDFD